MEEVFDSLVQSLAGRAVRRRPTALNEEAPGQEQLVVSPATAEDVAMCLKAARQLPDCSISVVGGNHSSYGGLGDIVFEMSHHFGGVSVDAAAGTVSAGGGATMVDIARVATAHGLAVPLGTAPTVGLGLILQGGVGHLGRLLGLALDAVVAVELVTASGDLLELRQGSGIPAQEELFWAVCGCGPNFGVVLSLTLAASPYMPCDTASRVFGPLPPGPTAASAFLKSYACRAASLPRDSSSDCILFFGGGGASHGQASPDARRLLMGVYDYNFSQAPLVAALELPFSDAESSGLLSSAEGRALSPVDLMEQEPYLTEWPIGTVKPGFAGMGCRSFFVRCVFLEASGSEWQEVLLARLREAPSEHCVVHLQHLGGKAAAESGRALRSFGPRGAQWSVVVTGCWSLDGTPEATLVEERACHQWVMDTVRVLLPHSLGTYSTDLGPGDLELAQHAFGENLAELLRLKELWDPQNLFSQGFPLAKLSSGL